MLGLVSSSAGAMPVNVLKAALPIGLGLASAAYLALKLTHSSNGFSSDKVYWTTDLPDSSSLGEEFLELR